MNSTSTAIERGVPVSDLSVDARAAFITRTYSHLMGAILGLILLEMYLFSSGLAMSITRALLGTNWLLVLGGFMIVGWMARGIARSSASPGMQYSALIGYVVAQGIILVPLLAIAESMAGGIIESAVTVTLMGFVGLTAVAWYTRKDFSFLGSVLAWGGICALLLIVASVLFGFELGTFFMVAMVALAGAAILYDTSNVLHHYPQDRHVSASLELFASVALLFWYVLQLFMSSRD